ncbi:MAG TPA: type II toxin-antitoxin system VapC family toxin [Pirellulales bacterium]|nr:type II toxin-antitoxin system VapC family toxin [Pirellulales bacterium]
MSFVVDTNTCSAYIKADPLVFNRFVQHGGQLYISVVTLGELTIWASRAKAPPKRAKDVQDLLSYVTIIEVNEDIGRKFGEVQAGLLDRGKPAPPLDLLIAATALVHGYIVVSHNTADFQNVPGLTVVDWLLP